jgi:hypothetical protein
MSAGVASHVELNESLRATTELADRLAELETVVECREGRRRSGRADPRRDRTEARRRAAARRAAFDSNDPTGQKRRERIAQIKASKTRFTVERDPHAPLPRGPRP